MFSEKAPLERYLSAVSKAPPAEEVIVMLTPICPALALHALPNATPPCFHTTQDRILQLVKLVKLVKLVDLREPPFVTGALRFDSSRAPISQEWMDATLSANPIVMFTYGVSPFCSEALSVMRSTGCSFKTVELGKTWLMLGPKGAALRAELVRRTGQTSLPHLFVNGKSLGGLFTGGEDGFTGGDGIDAMIAAGTFEDLLYKSGARCTAPEDVPSALGGFEGRAAAAQQKEHVQGCDPTSKLGKALHNADPNDPTLRPPGTLRDARGNIVPALGALDRDAMGAPMADQASLQLAELADSPRSHALIFPVPFRRTT